MELPMRIDGALQKTGWPWAGGACLPPRMDDGGDWPRITIVTPSLNQGRYIEETIRSVLLQGYPNLEYILMDGGSTDDTVDIIRRYEPWITRWASEPDKGQSHAINKGFRNSSGEIFGYINSDDIYEPGALAAMAKAYMQGGRPGLLAGDCWICDPELNPLRVFKAGWPLDLSHFLKPFASTFPQPASFFARNFYERVNGFDETLHYAFDQEFFLKMGLSGAAPMFIRRVLARYRDHRTVKTRHTVRFYVDALMILKRYGTHCGLTTREISSLRRKIENDVAYFETFTEWGRKGRMAAILYFSNRVIRYPDFLFDRKVLGQARRLFMFRARDVAELRNRNDLNG